MEFEVSRGSLALVLIIPALGIARPYFGGGKLLFLRALLRRSVIMQSGPEVNQGLFHFFFG